MNRFYTFGCAVVVIGQLTQTASVVAEETPAPTTAAETVSLFFHALAKGDIDRAVAFTAPLMGVPDEAVRYKYAELSEFAKAAAPQVIGHLQLGDAAVVIFHEGGPNKTTIDPAFLVRRDNKWLVVFKLTRHDRPYHQFDETTQARLKKLGDWFDSQKPQLQRMIGGA